MTKKQVLFSRLMLISIVILGGIFLTLKTLGDKKIDRVIKVKKAEKNIDNNTIEKEIKLNIRPDDFYKNKEKISHK